MPKPRRKAYLESALGEMSELEGSYEFPPPKNQRKRPVRFEISAHWLVGAEGNKATRAQ